MGFHVLLDSMYSVAVFNQFGNARLLRNVKRKLAADAFAAVFIAGVGVSWTAATESSEPDRKNELIKNFDRLSNGRCDS